MTTDNRGTARILLWVMSTLTVLVLLFGYRTSLVGADQMASGAETPIVGTASTSTGAGPRAGTAATPSRTVTGPSTQTRYGPVQVELTVTGSGSSTTVTDVAVLQYPNSNGKDAQINGYALPILIRETIEAQSSSVDMVSGATYTSVGYRTSLQAALDQAQA